MHFTIRREEEVNRTDKKVQTDPSGASHTEWLNSYQQKSADEPQEKRVLAQTQASGAKHVISTGLFKLKLIPPYIMAITATAVPQQVSYKYAPRWHRTYAAQALKSYYYSPNHQG